MQPKNQLLQKNNSSRRSYGWIIFLLATLLLLGLATLKQRAILDYIALYGYKPPAVIVALADEDKLTEEARRMFYVNHPELSDKQMFAQKCSSVNGREKTIVLGCYHGNQQGIYVLKVEDARLDGIEQVTAAHEMLHAAYDRLNARERDQIDAMLKDYYANKLTDERIKTTIDAYKVSEPEDIVNEMHSIFATEILELPADLESYYKRYFLDRKHVVGLANRYQAEFTSRQNAVKAYDAKLDTLKQQITNLEESIKTQQVTVTAEQNRLESLRSSGNTAEYNAAVPGYNQLVNRYNNQINQLQALVSQYNQTVVERNAIAIEQQELADALNIDAPKIK